jgi:tetratricopeptide (TPR) repeat protein
MSLPGLGNSRPGIGNGTVGGRSGDMRSDFRNSAGTADLRNRMDSHQSQISDRRANVPERRDELQSRLSDRNGAYDRQGQRQDFRNGAREDWQSFHDDHYYHHHGWHGGCWHGSGSYWNHMWDHYPVYSAFRVTAWGINTASWMFGYRPYVNPYYVAPVSQTVNVNYSTVNYSQPMLAETATTGDASQSSAPPVPSAAATTAFDSAREAFRSGDYAKALQLTDQTLKETPRDAVVHEFRALILFATGDYKESAAALYSILAVGPGWDWTTMSGLYGEVNDYTSQLRKLEDFVKANPTSGEGHFVLGYHYMTCTNNDAALEQFQTLAKLQPNDVVVGSLISMLGGEPPAASRPAPPSAAISSAEPVDPIPQETLVGVWTASGPQSTVFQLTLTTDGKFTWAFTQSEKTQSVSGVYALDGHALAMEPDAGGTMLAEIALNDAGGFAFRQIGTPEGDQGLMFSKR